MPKHRGTGIIPGVRVGEEIDLLVVGVADTLERLLADAGPGSRAAKQSDDRGALGAAVTGIASGDHVGSDPALAVRRAGQRDEAPLAGAEVLDLDGVADGEDVGIAGAHVLVNANASALADFKAGGLCQLRFRAERRARGSRCRPGYVLPDLVCTSSAPPSCCANPVTPSLSTSLTPWRVTCPSTRLAISRSIGREHLVEHLGRELRRSRDGQGSRPFRDR